MSKASGLAVLAAVGLLTVRAADLAETCPVGPNVRGHENVEWSIGYGYHLTDEKKDLPRVLLVGDSICNGYQGFVQKFLEGRVNVSFWVSSYCVTSPGYLKLLDFYLSEAKYDVVHFNNGLHTPQKTSPEVWGQALEAALKLVRARQPQAKVVWTTSTPLKDAERTKYVRELNAAAATVVSRLGGIATDDLFALLDPLDRATNWADMFHHREPVRMAAGRQVSAAVCRALGLTDDALSSAPLTVSPDGLTPAAALARVRAAREAGDLSVREIRVKGVNALKEPLVLTEADHDVVFVGEDGAAFSGGLAVTGWKDVGDGVWEADAPRRADGTPIFFDQLWANGRRAPNARLPNEGWLDVSAASQTVVRVEGGVTNYQELVVFTNDAVRALADVPKEDWPYLEAGVIVNWCYGLRALASYDGTRNAVTFETPVKWQSWKVWRPSNTRVAFNNVRSAFDAPGEWFLDMKAGKVRYRPLAGETLASFACVVPRPGLSRLVDFRGDWQAGKTAQRVVFRNLAFLHTSTVKDRNRPEELVMHQAASGMDGAVTAEGVREVSFENCRVAHTANYAMRFNSACVSNRIVGCTLEDVGAGGVWMGADYAYMKKKAAIPRKILPPTRADAVAFNLISNCTIRALGRYDLEGTGVALTHCSDTKVVHCDIHDVYYTGVSVGWTWGFYGSVAQRNEIAFNRIWDLGKGVMSDMGGVYTLGTSFGTHVHDNVIHDVKSLTYGGWGLYTDEGSEGIVMERNLVWNTTDGGFHQHFGTGCIIRNNIFAWNRLIGAVRTYRKVVQDVPCSLYFANNIVLVREGALCGEGVSGVYGLWANNLWYDVRGEAQAVFEKTDWRGWCATGKETGGRFADPKFVDAEHFDFTLRPDSPALAIGFKPFDFSRAGCR